MIYPWEEPIEHKWVGTVRDFPSSWKSETNNHTTKLIIKEYSDIGCLFWGHEMSPSELEKQLRNFWVGFDLHLFCESNDIIIVLNEDYIREDLILEDLVRSVLKILGDDDAD